VALAILYSVYSDAFAARMQWRSVDGGIAFDDSHGFEGEIGRLSEDRLPEVFADAQFSERILFAQIASPLRV
jgi:hypothetical protein